VQYGTSLEEPGDERVESLVEALTTLSDGLLLLSDARLALVALESICERQTMLDLA
jgi:hypothetical protein